MSKIALVADNMNNFPSLPLMKISAFHKTLGDQVKLVDNNLEKFDICYISKTFNLDLEKISSIPYLPESEKYIFGGSGYAIERVEGKEVYTKELDINLPEEIENCFPDYSLYPHLTKNTAYGFLTRGCPNNCGFCIVAKKEGLCSKKIADLKTFWNGQSNITLLDANLLACKDRENLIHQLIESKANINYCQGLDARFIDDDISKLLCKTKIKMVHFAFDLIKNEDRILKGLKIFANYFEKDDRSKRVYILTNFNTSIQEDYYRVKKVIELGYSPYVMIYQKGTHPQFLTDLARWANSMFLYRSTSFADYSPRTDGKTMKTLYGRIIK